MSLDPKVLNRELNGRSLPTQSYSEAKLRLESVVKRFGDFEAVRNVSLDVEDGLFLTILGPSGSGKTSLLRMIAGFMPATSGSIFLGGRNISNMSPGKRDIGMVFQNYALFPHMTALQNICYPLKMRKWKRDDQKRRGLEVLELVGLGGFESRMPHALSGGQQQRVAVARALAFKPRLLLMDEPLGALDRELRVRMAGELRRLHEDLGNTVLYVTHDREEALTLSDRIAVMRDGVIESIGSPQDLYARPDTGFVASFFGGHNVVKCSNVELLPNGGARVSWLNQTVDAPSSARLNIEKQVCLSIPCDALGIIPTESHEQGPSILAVVHSSVYMGNQIQVICDVISDVDGDKPQLKIDLAGGQAKPPLSGTVIRLSLRTEQMTVVNP
jgi:ABC-type Fe3+/spermidine/putrescine transport system ATPase subunit